MSSKCAAWWLLVSGTAAGARVWQATKSVAVSLHVGPFPLLLGTPKPWTVRACACAYEPTLLFGQECLRKRRKYMHCSISIFIRTRICRLR